MAFSPYISSPNCILLPWLQKFINATLATHRILATVFMFTRNAISLLAKY